MSPETTVPFTLNLHQVEKSLDVRQSRLINSTFVDVDLSGASFDDINFSGAQIRNANLSNWQIQDANLAKLQVTNADLRGATFTDCLTEGMSIDGILVADLLAAYQSAQGNQIRK